MNTINNFSQIKQSGFTLVEVTLAIGIIAFALVAILGVLPIGLMANREAAEEMAYAYIFQHISGELALLPFEDLGAYRSKIKYFDQEGAETKESDAVYVVNFGSEQEPVYPGSINLDSLDQRLERITLKISHIGEPESAAYQLPVSVVNNGL